MLIIYIQEYIHITYNYIHSAISLFETYQVIRVSNQEVPLYI